MGPLASKSSKVGGTTKQTPSNDFPPAKVEDVIGYLDFQHLVSSGSVAMSLEEFGIKVWFWKPVHTTFYPLDRDTAAQLKKYSKPEYININYSKRKVESIAKELTRISKYLRGIDISRLEEVDIHQIQEIIEKYRRIESFAVCVKARDVQQCINLLGTCKYLQRLELHGDLVYTGFQTDLKPIADGCPLLKHFDVQCTLYDIESVMYLLERNKHQIKSFLCSTGGFHTDGFLPIFECEDLEHISFDFSISCYQTKNVLKVIPSSTKIKALGFKSCNDTSPDFLIRFFTDRFFPKLVELDLSFYKKINESLAVTIRNYFPKMTKLRLNGCFMYHVEGLKELLKLENLVHIELSKAYFSEIWFEQLLECKKLKYLDLRFCSDMQDVHASKLVKTLKLEYLNLSSCVCLSDKFLEDVPLCTTLRELVVRSAFSEQGVTTLQHQAPSVFIRKNK